ncbi:methyltransferase domain-containing protein [Arenibacter sp. TNZ]|jgi:thiopurine S-methyltransferase|uniref:methyltransferase domain-containing protein n=1 Tax=Arenibacter TaxID=178469 RepID=UPI000CD3B737|nr:MULTISPECIES: methyltransferase domain-containing protein [Arenibacter]MCM4173686.1 methyltransferase domain-containing protein [Arenibacter sp. TNZ]
MKLNKDFWEHKYDQGDMGWDVGYISTPLKEYIDQLTNKNLKILIPGAGNSYELLYLVENGFSNVYVVDIAKQPLDHIQQKIPIFPQDQLIEGDFFDLELNNFDLILEQTFFCALDPSLRKNYVLKMRQLLKPNGKLVGLLFNFPFTEAGPPFGGSREEYKSLFQEHFNIKILKTAHNSIKPRADKELFFIFESK